MSKLIKRIEEIYPDSTFMKMDGFDDCLEGVVERFGQEPILCYDKDKVLNKLEKQGMSVEEAVEYFEFNQIGAWMGEYTPCFLVRVT